MGNYLEIINPKSLFKRNNKFKLIVDKYTTITDVQNALKNAKLEGVNLVFGIDCTSSNKENGEHTFNGRSLHHTEKYLSNPYQQVIKYLGETLEPFDEDGQIPAYGFGDINTKHRLVFNFHPERKMCHGFKEVLSLYNEIIPCVTFSGPTSFGPLIRQTIDIVKHLGTYHILIIITDGEINDGGDTENAIVEASHYPISIITIGVGDSSFELMKKFDDELPRRKFDNFQFVNYNEVIRNATCKSIAVQVQFAIDALQEIPEQYNYLKSNNLLVCGQETKTINDTWQYKGPIANKNVIFKENISDKSNINDNLCPICHNNVANAVLVPCGHTICFDGECKTFLKHCHICRQKYNQIVKYYQ